MKPPKGKSKRIAKAGNVFKGKLSGKTTVGRGPDLKLVDAKPKVVIIDNNPLSIASYIEEHGDGILKSKTAGKGRRLRPLQSPPRKDTGGQSRTTATCASPEGGSSEKLIEDFEQIINWQMKRSLMPYDWVDYGNPQWLRIKYHIKELAHYKTKDTEAQATIVRQQQEIGNLHNALHPAQWGMFDKYQKLKTENRELRMDSESLSYALDSNVELHKLINEFKAENTKLREEVIGKGLAKDVFIESLKEQNANLKREVRINCDDRKKYLDERNRLKAENEKLKERDTFYLVDDEGRKVPCSRLEMAKELVPIHKAFREQLLKEIDSLKSKLADAKQKNVGMSEELGKAKKAASSTTDNKLEKENKHLREQLKKMAKRSEETE